MVLEGTATTVVRNVTFGPENVANIGGHVHVHAVHIMKMFDSVLLSGFADDHGGGVFCQGVSTCIIRRCLAKYELMASGNIEPWHVAVKLS